MFGKKKPAEKKSTARKPTAKKAGGESLPHAPARKRSSATPSPKGDTPLKSPASSTSELHTAFKKGHWSVEKGTIGAQKRTA